MALMRPSPQDRILDIGVSLDTGALEANALERYYPHPSNITCAGLEPSAAVEKVYPGVRFVRIEEHAPLPFPDKAFDVVYSNAVLEHVGARDRQAAFVREALRVARRFFIVVPNRFFPVEHHTGLLLIHYLPPAIFRGFLRRTRWSHWSDEANLNHLTAREFKALFEDPQSVEIAYAGVGLGMLSSNIIAHS